MIKIILLVLIMYVSCPAQSGNYIISTSQNNVWKMINGVTEKNYSSNNYYDVELLTAAGEQKITGWGGCFNEAGWEVLNVLQKNDREAVLNSLFNPDSGCGFDLCRLPLGANDYSLDFYSHNDTPDDFKMENFNIDRDKKYLIPYIKEALKINPLIKLWCSPWSPPVWMKSNNHYACRTSKVNDLPQSQQGREMETQFIMNEKYLSAYALYFSKFLTEYKKEKIDIISVQVQNEPNSCQVFPSCIWKPEDLAVFIGEFLGPNLKKDHPQTEVWLGTIERPNFERIATILDNKAAANFIKGVGFQWAGKDAVGQVKKNYPGLKLMQTETECGNGDNDWNAAEYTFNLMKQYFEKGVNSYMYWNMVLDESGKSRWGWKQNSMITINRETKKIIYNPEYYLIKHFSRFIKPKARKIKTEGKNENLLAFKNSDNSVVVVFMNNKEDDQILKIKIENKVYTLPAAKKSVNTFVVAAD